jgi:hypothetical protein
MRLCLSISRNSGLTAGHPREQARQPVRRLALLPWLPSPTVLRMARKPVPVFGMVMRRSQVSERSLRVQQDTQCSNKTWSTSWPAPSLQALPWPWVQRLSSRRALLLPLPLSWPVLPWRPASPLPSRALPSWLRVSPPPWLPASWPVLPSPPALRLPSPAPPSSLPVLPQPLPPASWPVLLSPSQVLPSAWPQVLPFSLLPRPSPSLLSRVLSLPVSWMPAP